MPKKPEDYKPSPWLKEAVPVTSASPYKKPPLRHEVPTFGEKGAVPEYKPEAAGRRRVLEARLKRGEPVSIKLLAEFPDLIEKYKLPTPEPSMPEIPTTVMTMFEPAARIELPVVNAVSALRDENIISSGFHEKLNQRWTIIFKGDISQKAKDAAKKAFLDVSVRTTRGGSIWTDVSLPEVGVTELGRAEEAFDDFAEFYSGKKPEVNLVEQWLINGEATYK